MAKTFIAIIFLCTLLGSVTSLPHEEKHIATNQEEYMIKRQEIINEARITDQAPAEETANSEQSPTEGTGASEGSTTEETGTPEQPAADETGTSDQPAADETGTPEQPAADETGTPELPAADETGTSDQPAADIIGNEAIGGETETPAVDAIGGENETPTGDAAEGAKPSIVDKEYNANEATDWLFTLTINNPPQDQSNIFFQEGAGQKVGIGESTASFEFRKGTIETDGMLEIPVYVKDHNESKQMSFTVELNGESTSITVNVKAAEPKFKVLQNMIKATEQTQYKFILKMQAKDEKVNYKFKEGDQEVVAGGETNSLKFGDLVHMAEGNMDQIEVSVTDLSKNNISFDVTASNTTETVTVDIEPPVKPMLLQKEFMVNEINNYTFTLQIKAKSIPDVVFKEGDQEAKPEETTAHFTFGTMTNDVDNLYTIQVKVSKDINEPRKFIAKLNNEEEEVTVKREDKSSALISASATLASLFVPLFVILLL